MLVLAQKGIVRVSDRRDLGQVAINRAKGCVYRRSMITIELVLLLKRGVISVVR